MTRTHFYDRLAATLEDLDASGLTKHERLILSPQGASIEVGAETPVLNFCANNYLGLADNQEIIAAAGSAMNDYGHGMASVRFICGTTDLHQRLEARVAAYVGKEDAITFAACFDANGGLFEPLLGPDDAIVSDSLNHASIIDGIRLCKAKRYRYATRDLKDLRAQLQAARTDGAQSTLIATDGVFSMDGYVADLAGICELADEFDALIMIDDCHATGIVGPQGRGTAAHHDVIERIDVITSTFGKSLGGAMGGFTAGSQALIDVLRQKSRPYLFSNALSPAHVGGAIKAIELAEAGDELRARLTENASYFRAAMADAGFSLIGEGHPIIPVMIGAADKAAEMAAQLLERGVYVTAFSYPVVPHNLARIRTQMNASHSTTDLDRAVAAFVSVGESIGLL